MLNYLVAFIAVLCVSYTTAAKSCNGTARYTLTFKGEWSSKTHNHFPSGAHFSSLVGCSHDSSYVMWAPGRKASGGVQLVAERGRAGTLENEMQEQIDLKKAWRRYTGDGISPSPGTTSIEDIEVNTKYPLVSFISMIAPSPDWFVGVRGWDLCDKETGKWRNSSIRDLPPYDAGTDSGSAFNSGNDATSPPENIFRITNNTEGSLSGDKPLARFGTFTFIKTAENTTGSLPALPPNRAQTGINLSMSLFLILCISSIVGYFL